MIGDHNHVKVKRLKFHTPPVIALAKKSTALSAIFSLARKRLLFVFFLHSISNSQLTVLCFIKIDLKKTVQNSINKTSGTLILFSKLRSDQLQFFQSETNPRESSSHSLYQLVISPPRLTFRSLCSHLAFPFPPGLLSSTCSINFSRD